MDRKELLEEKQRILVEMREVKTNLLSHKTVKETQYARRELAGLTAKLLENDAKLASLKYKYMESDRELYCGLFMKVAKRELHKDLYDNLIELTKELFAEEKKK
jgi:hypothetical protein